MQNKNYKDTSINQFQSFSSLLSNSFFGEEASIKNEISFHMNIDDDIADIAF